MGILKFSNTKFNLLVKLGFGYCYSRTQQDPLLPERTIIILTPLLDERDLLTMPDCYDTYFNIIEEPRQMSESIDGRYIGIY